MKGIRCKNRKIGNKSTIKNGSHKLIKRKAFEICQCVPSRMIILSREMNEK